MATLLNEKLLEKLKKLKLHGLIANWDKIRETEWIQHLIEWEEKERSYRSLERRLSSSRVGTFKPLVEFDWKWPKKIDREIIEELTTLEFIKEKTNIILLGPNGAGKTMIAKNLVHQALLQGHTVLFSTAGHMLNDLASQDGDNALRRRLKYYAQPTLLCIDELGYLSYSNRHADLLFEVVSKRHQEKPTIVTTNKAFSEWGEIFPNAACVVTVVDRLVHRSEIINIDSDSYRVKEAKERSIKQREARLKRKAKTVGKIEEVAP